MASPALKLQVLGAYRTLLRTRRLFSADPRMYTVITEKARGSFEQNRNETDTTKIQSLIKEAQDAATILTRHVQQVEAIGDTRYKLVVRPGLTTHDMTPTQIEWLSGGCGGKKKQQ